MEGLEKEIAAKNEELVNADGTLKAIEDYQNQNQALVTKLGEAQELIKQRDKVIKERDEMMEGQNSFIQELADQINGLETHIRELNLELSKENTDIEALRDELKEKEQLLESQQLGRQQSARNLMLRFRESIAPDSAQPSYRNLASLAYVASQGSDNGDDGLTKQASQTSVGVGMEREPSGILGIAGTSITSGKRPRFVSDVASEKNQAATATLQNQLSQLKQEKLLTNHHLEELESENKHYKKSTKKLEKELEKEKNEHKKDIEELEEQLKTLQDTLEQERQKARQDEIAHEEKVDEYKPLINNDEKRRQDDTAQAGNTCVVFGFPLW